MLDLRLDRFFENRQEQKFIPATISIYDNPNINKNLLDDIINNGTINNYSDEQLFILLSNNLRGFLLNIFDKKDQRYIKMIISDRMLRVLIKVVNNIEIDYMNRIYLNKLCYDYLTSDEKSKNVVIDDLIYHLAKITNKKYIPILIGRGIPEKIACYIVLSRWSDNDEMLNVRRMNFVIMTVNFNFSEQMIVDVYQTLFERVTQLFEATMLDVFDSDEEWYTETIDENYSRISLALLDILDSLPSDSIRRVLDDYNNLYNISYNGYPTRFDLGAISSDYANVYGVIKIMEQQGIRLP